MTFIVMKKISIVIPNFNGKSLLRENLPGILKNFPGNEIIIVDDGSEDESVNFIKKRFSQVKVLVNKKNFGFSTTANRGIRAAKSSLVLLLNNDCQPQKNIFQFLLPYFDDKKTFAVSCLEKSAKKSRGRGIGGFKKGLFYHKPGKLDKNNTLWAFAACTLYNKEIFEKIGGFDENFNPFYWEDFDLSYRALKSGYKIFFEKKAVVYHKESSTINKYFSPFQIKQISFRNQLMVSWKNLTDKDYLIWHLIWLPYYLILTTIKTRGAFLLGFLKALMKLLKILEKRKNNKFVYSDKEVLAPFQNKL